MTNSALSQPAGKTKLVRYLSDDYLVGFVEGEGMFYIGVVPSSETRTGWQVIYFFKVSQNPSGKKVLEFLKNRLVCGYIKKNNSSGRKDKSLAFVVRDLSGLLDRVIPFFENKLLIKRDAFNKFKQVLMIVKARQHLTKEGIKKILDISYSMNTQKRRYSKEEILKSY